MNNNIPNANQKPTPTPEYYSPTPTPGYQNPAQAPAYYHSTNKNYKMPSNQSRTTLTIGTIVAILILVAVAYFIFSSLKSKINIEDIANNVKINGVTYKWASTINELGDGWDWNPIIPPMNINTDDGEKTVAIATYNGEMAFSCLLHNYVEGSDGKDNLIYAIILTDSDDPSANTVSIDGLMIGDSKQDVLDKYGKPKTTEKDGSEETLRYTEEWGEKDLIVTIENGKISSIFLIYLPDKYK